MRKARYLAASAVSLAKPFLLGAVAVGIGLSDSGGFASSYLRYLVFPHIIPALCLFFLYLDEERYRTYKPLVAFFELGSALYLAAALVPAAGNLQKLLLATRNAQGFSRTALAFALALLLDLFCCIVLLPGTRRSVARGSVSTGAGGDVLPTNKER